MTVNELISSLDALNEAQQRELYDQLAFRFTLPAATPVGTDGEIWDAMHAALHAHPRAFADFAKAYGRKKYSADAKSVVELIERACGEKLKKGQRLALLKLAFESLADVLAEQNIPATPKTLLQNTQWLTYALDCSFPGYASAKLLHRVVPLISG